MEQYYEVRSVTYGAYGAPRTHTRTFNANPDRQAAETAAKAYAVRMRDAGHDAIDIRFITVEEVTF